MNKILIVFTVLISSLTTTAQVVINEIMQSNIDCITDDLNQFPDSWVELYNSGTQAVNLSNYKVNDTNDASSAWQLPSKMIGPHQYQLIYCDKEAKEWHTPFRLESGKGCTFYLFKDGQLVDQLPTGMKKQPAPNVAYGRTTDGNDTWAYQLEPSPGKANTGHTCGVKDILDSPIFSVQGKVFANGESFTLELTMPAGAPADTEIRYTLDGSEPTATSRPYTGPITISMTRVVRAKPFCKGYLSPRAVTQSYISFPREVTLPVISIATDSKYLNDNKFGILVEGTYGGGHKNYEYNWRRPMNFEVFDGDLQKSCINQLGEARVTGAASRGAALKSLAIYANKRFGEKRFSHEFFPDQRPGITDYKSLMLRNAGNDFDYLYMRDAIIQCHMAKYVDIDWQAYKPAIVYINGEYKGMLNIRERSNEDNIYTNYGGLEDIDMVENMWEQKEGDIHQWYDFQGFYNDHGHTYAEYDKRMDVLEFINVMILNLYYCNLDFPGNNIVHWKPQAEGGRWRVLVKDTDFGLGLYGRDADYQMFKWLYNPDYDPNNNWAVGYDATRLFRRLMEDKDFEREFIDRFAIYMGDFMNYDRTWETWEPMYEAVKYEYPYHRNLFNRWWPVYSDELSSAKDWLKARTNNMYRQINDYYKVGTPKDLKISAFDGESTDGIKSVTFNGVKLSRNAFDGKFFAKRQMNLEAEGAGKWVVTEYSSAGRIRTEYNGTTLTYVIPESVSRVEIAAVAKDAETSVVPSTSESVIFEGTQEIDWWNEAVWFGPETFPDFLSAESIVVTLTRPKQNANSVFRFQTVNNDWSQTFLPGQALVPGCWGDGVNDILVVFGEDGSIEIPLTQADKDLIDESLIRNIMIVGSNTVITKVVLKSSDAGMHDVTMPASNDGKTYNLLGVPVDESYKGIVIRNGKKFINR